LESIWKPRYQILLTVVAFVIIEYFFSILLYFFFRDQVAGNCEKLGHCFAFVFSTTFLTINGFVGYLFQLDEQKRISQLRITPFEVFENLYVIVIHLIMFAVMLAVIINSFITARGDSARQKESLRGACLVCNIERSRFNASLRSGFRIHINSIHHLFSYFECKYRLLQPTRQLPNDLELWVLQCSNNEWIPENRTLELGPGPRAKGS
jgi:hypothetical protein